MALSLSFSEPREVFLITYYGNFKISLVVCAVVASAVSALTRLVLFLAALSGVMISIIFDNFWLHMAVPLPMVKSLIVITRCDSFFDLLASIFTLQSAIVFTLYKVRLLLGE